MLKKKTAILLITLAYAIQLGHNIIPHHHHDSDHDLAEHHQTDHHHDDNEDTEGLNHLLSHFTHSADGFTTTIIHNSQFTIHNSTIVAVLPDNFYSDKFLIPPLLHKPPAEHFIYISPHSLSSGLRAPPVFIS